MRKQTRTAAPLPPIESKNEMQFAVSRQPSRKTGCPQIFSANPRQNSPEEER
jgi:hypothetical protein